ncbi:hypothetical protein PIB30_044546 [Stylosanthes scabra]|uniref:Uncharacterized protein n=1 Tax=Stylosanthes scabra TaxID=79078 RepID=A0ABU6TFJ7_9FABA|nr:hypothetical protein [Stylosanthes scabra]
MLDHHLDHETRKHASGLNPIRTETWMRETKGEKAYPLGACWMISKRMMRASRSRKPCVNRSSGSKGVGCGDIAQAANVNPASFFINEVDEDKLVSELGPLCDSLQAKHASHIKRIHSGSPKQLEVVDAADSSRASTEVPENCAGYGKASDDIIADCNGAERGAAKDVVADTNSIEIAEGDIGASNSGKRETNDDNLDKTGTKKSKSIMDA